MTLKFIFFGDVVGKIGRRALAQIVPKWRKKYAPHLVCANAENLAHGKGFTPSTMREAMAAGIDFFTGGNHIFDNKAGLKIFDDPELSRLVVRPLNYPTSVPGEGCRLIEVERHPVLIASLNGQVGFRESFDSPFLALDKMVHRHIKQNPAIIVDFHSETTSEKVAFGLYSDGRVSAVLGTHTHIPTADAKVLPQGTGYISDIGMVGEENSVIGVKQNVILNNFITQIPQMHEFAETGRCEVNAVYFEIDSKSHQCLKIKLLQTVVDVK
ncbi:MAG: TIGR00282 family metallophosphoesterase [Patescibacteria group bacterium]|nr:TIGR00282 family metallophosphoesterase [Patescibacteria group bacterium]